MTQVMGNLESQRRQYDLARSAEAAASEAQEISEALPPN
jgi:hypothetical protein